MSDLTIDVCCARCGQEMVVTFDYPPVGGEWVCERCAAPPRATGLLDRREGSRVSEIEVNTYSLRDLRYFRVYCRFCGRQNTFWDKVKHTKQCIFPEAFRAEFEHRRQAGAPDAAPAGGETD